jgi:hypothetical protein
LLDPSISPDPVWSSFLVPDLPSYAYIVQVGSAVGSHDMLGTYQSRFYKDVTLINESACSTGCQYRSITLAIMYFAKPSEGPAG